MLSNYIQITVRSFTKSKFYSIINILGLSLGITAISFILLYINDELGYDRYFKNYKNIYRLESDININNKQNLFAKTPAPLGPTMMQEIPEIQACTRFREYPNAALRYMEKEIVEKKVFFTDSTTPEMFTLDFIEGDAKTALTDPFTIVLSESAAKRYFDSQPAYGKMLISDGDRSYKVTGVFKDLPQNVHMTFDILMSIESYYIIQNNQFNSYLPRDFWHFGYYTFITVNNPSDIATIHAKSVGVYNKYMKEMADDLHASFKLLTTRLDKVHLSTNLTADFPAGNRKYLVIMAIVGVMILLLAAINYTNLATARATKRAREIGLRKVSGASRSQLASQFFTESLILTISALVISLLLIQVLLPFFNDLSNKQLNLSIFKNPSIILLLLGISILTGIIAGIYPAVYLSSFEPSRVLKGKLKLGREGALLRKGLVTLQLTLSVIMITGTIIIYNQLAFMRSAELGFGKENILTLEIQDTAFRNHGLQRFRDELLTNPDILLTSMSRGLPGSDLDIRLMRVEKDGRMQEYGFYNIPCDYDYAKLLNLEFVSGRDFDENNKTDKTEAVIINETTAREMGWGKDALGKIIITGHGNSESPSLTRKVIGVVKDFNFRSLHNPVEPLIMYISDIPMSLLSIKLREGYNKSTLELIKEKWEMHGANRPFDYYFLDENFMKSYESEGKLGQVFSTFAILSIFIALLGLIGLSSFITALRTREIGIRKVLGASIEGITGLLYKESLILVIIACMISIPISWFMLSRWLDNFAYHVNITWFTFLIASITAIIACLAAVSYHTLKAANSNPIVSIKYE